MQILYRSSRSFERSQIILDNLLGMLSKVKQVPFREKRSTCRVKFFIFH